MKNPPDIGGFLCGLGKFFEGLADSDGQAAVFVVTEVELVDQPGDHLEESAPALAEVVVETLHLLHLADFFHFLAAFGFEAPSRVAHFERHVEDVALGTEGDEESVLIERHAAVFDGVIDEFVGNEREAVLPRNVDGVTFEKAEDEVANHLRLAVVGLERDGEVERTRIGDFRVREI